MVKFVDSVDLFLFHNMFLLSSQFLSRDHASARLKIPAAVLLVKAANSNRHISSILLSVNALDIVKQREFTALICFKERSDLLAL